MDFILRLAMVVGIIALFASLGGVAYSAYKEQDPASQPTAHSMAAPVTPVVVHDFVYVFVSFSMPKESLQRWAAQAKKTNAPLVIQGLVDDSFTKTQQAVAALSHDGQSGVVLDPRLFRQYHIQQVPAVVVVHPTDLKPCLPNQSCWHSEVSDVIIGDVGLESALQVIAERGDNAQVAEQLLAEERQ